MTLMQENPLLGALKGWALDIGFSRIKIITSTAIKTTGTLTVTGTESQDGLGFSWHKWIDLGLKKGHE